VETTNFPSLQNQNLSYFVGVNATFDRPGSILAGDRNLATNAWFQPTIMGYGSASSLTWTWEMHQQKGDILFADGHVEQWNDSSFGSGGNEVPGMQSFFLPSVLPTQNSFANASQGSGSGSGAGGYGNSASTSAGMPSSSGNSPPSARQNPSQPNNREPSMSYSVNNPLFKREADSEPASPSATIGNTSASQESSSADAPAYSDAGMSDFNRKLTRNLQGAVEWGYFWLWLLALLYVAYRIWKWYEKRDARIRAEMARRLPRMLHNDNEDSTSE
jgi:prepilin-type processing-associated H-X9-DG protein